MFCISAYLESHRDTDYDRLLAVSREHAWTQWCVSFLEAVQQQALENLTKAKSILDLYDAMKARFVDLNRSQYAIHALDWVFERPIFKSADFACLTDPRGHGQAHSRGSEARRYAARDREGAG